MAIRIMLVLALASAAFGQDKRKELPPPVEQAAIDKAIKKGVEHLRRTHPADPMHPGLQDELVLWTLVHAGVPETDEHFAALLKAMTERRLSRTYPVALQAMILEELDRVAWQWRIAQCAQFLVDNQSAHGFWSYGEALKDDTPTGAAKPKDVATGAAKAKDTPAGPRTKPKVVKTIEVKRRPHATPLDGDNSNSQYAMLGLRACHDAGVRLPAATADSARRYWESQQCDDGGWLYHSHHPGRATYGSMTAGGVGSLLLCAYLQSSDPKSAAVKRGVDWLAANFAVDRNPGAPDPATWHHYWLYGLERAAIFHGSEKIGAHWWYSEGAKHLLATHKPDLAWVSVEDTCFAILFLARGTRPLQDVATESAADKRK